MATAGQTNARSQTKDRSEMKCEDCWNVEAMYPSWEAWEEELKEWGREKDVPHWPEIGSFRAKWSGSVVEIRGLIELVLTIDRELSKLFTYAHLRHDEDVASEVPKTAYGRILSLFYAFRQETSWIEPELLQLSQEKLEQILSAAELKEFKIYLEKIVRMKPHTLSASEEELLAFSGNALEVARQAFSAFNNADLKFPPVVDSQGNTHELTHGTYQLYLRNQDRTLREGAFKNVHRAFSGYENTLCELLQGHVQRHVFEVKARKFSSCLEASLFPQQIETSVYTSLIQAVRKHLPALHRYVALRKRFLGVSEVHLYDLSVPLIKDVNMSMPYDEAAELIVESLSVMGKEYQEELKRGLTTDRWVDRYENTRKRSGAYSSGCYDSMPYILMNYHNTFNDVMTLTHEAGHSMHSLLSREHQPYQYSDYSIFVAEVASTFHEELLMRHLLNKLTKAEQKAYLINQRIDDMRATLLRQTMFAEFELQVHKWAEEGKPLTPSLLKQAYMQLNRDYFGPDVVIDQEIEIEWARIPHFYSNFYVYQYATGISAALALADKVLTEGAPARDQYLKFLSSGSSLYPIDVLKMAGVDMTSSSPVEAAMLRFESLVDELEKILSEKKI